VLIQTGADQAWGTPEYLVKGAGMDRESTLFLLKQGIKVVGRPEMEKADIGTALKYVLYKMGCIHPFQLSRILALADILALKETGTRATDARYVAGPGVFYIEGIKERFQDDPCIDKIEGDPAAGRRGCIRYVCSEPPEPAYHAKKYLDTAISEAQVMDPKSLNEIIISHPLYKMITSTS